MYPLGARHHTQPRLIFLTWKVGSYYQAYFTAEDRDAEKFSDFPSYTAPRTQLLGTFSKAAHPVSAVPDLGPCSCAIRGSPLTGPRSAGPSQSRAKRFLTPLTTSKLG